MSDSTTRPGASYALPGTIAETPNLYAQVDSYWQEGTWQGWLYGRVPEYDEFNNVYGNARVYLPVVHNAYADQ